MTKKEAIARIKDHIAVHKYLERGAIHIIEALDMATKALEREHWIPVSERLPEENQMCLVCDKGYIGIDTYLGHGGIYEWKIYIKNYDAWMPLPEPYKEGE